MLYAIFNVKKEIIASYLSWYNFKQKYDLTAKNKVANIRRI